MACPRHSLGRTSRCFGTKRTVGGWRGWGETSETRRQTRNLAEGKKAARRNEDLQGWKKNSNLGNALGGDATDAVGGSNERRLVGLRGGSTVFLITWVQARNEIKERINEAVR